MPNNDTIAFLSGGTNVGDMPTLSNISTTETVVTVVPNPITSGGGGVATLSIPQVFDNGDMFKLRAFGTLTTNAATNVVVNLYLGTSSNVSNDSAVFAMTAVNCNSQTSQWMLEGVFQWDSVGKKLNGIAKSRLAGTIQAEAAITPVANVNAASQLQFLLAAKFGSADVKHTLYVNEFACDVV